VLNPCTWEIDYATSSDGTLWTGTRPNVPGLGIADVPWAAGETFFGQTMKGLQPGAVEAPAKPGDPYTIWFSPIFAAGIGPAAGCVPYSIGKATRM